MRDPWAAIGDAAALTARGVFVAEGRRVIQRVLDGAAGGTDAIVAALATPAAADALALASHLGDRLDVRTPGEMQALTGFNFHRGALALVRRPPAVSVADIVSACRQAGVTDAPARRRPILVVGERIADADNVGSLFRNARAFGAAGMLLDERSADPLYRKAVRTSLGAVLDLPWSRAPLTDILATLDAAGVMTVGLTPDPAALPIVAIGVDQPRGVPVALLVGNEGEGLSREARQACTRSARIPMAPGADSLNVAAALAVALYELRRDGRD